MEISRQKRCLRDDPDSSMHTVLLAISRLFLSIAEKWTDKGDDGVL